VGAIAPRAETFSHRLPDPEIGAPSTASGFREPDPRGSRLLGPARLATRLACTSFDRRFRLRRDMRAADPLRRRLREPVPVVRSLTLPSVSGHRPRRSNSPWTAAPAKKGGVDPETQSATSFGRDWRPGHASARGASRPLTVPWQSQAGAATESNRARTRRSVPFPSDLTKRSLEERLAGPVGVSGGASCRRTPRRDTSIEDVLTQLVKDEHPRATSTSRAGGAPWPA
jgi:hypothetical protein